MQLQELYDKMISEGFSQFYIEGIGGPSSNDVVCFGKIGSQWAVYYSERGQKSTPEFTSESLDEAAEYYYNLIAKIQHLHLVVFTRKKDVIAFHREQLEINSIHVIQNDIPSYQKRGDRVYRLFVMNKDIFTAKRLFTAVPFYDVDIKQ